MNSFIGVDIKKPLYEYCRNATNKEGDTFVGVKSEILEGEHCISVHFPLGHYISQKEEEVRQEILQLFLVLQKYNDEKSIISTLSKDQLLRTVRFPVQAYLTVIYYYLNNGYYQIKESNYVSGLSGNINMGRTLKKETPIATQKGMIYPKFQVRKHTDTDKDLITEINKYCVYESYLKLGWLYKLPLMIKPVRTREILVYRQYLQGIWLKETKDEEKKLFKAMLDILDFTSHAEEPEEFYFGTNHFEYVWEKLIQDIFGNVKKEDYFPRTSWMLRIGKNRDNRALQPDTVMKHEGNIFVLDAKYYKYGDTQNVADLPNSSSINKQISYGEYIATNSKFETERRNGMKIFNAFLLPHNSNTKPYNEEESPYYYIGEAVSEWKSNEETYERVQGILVDVKFLINNSIGANQKAIMDLSNLIIAKSEENKGQD